MEGMWQDDSRIPLEKGDYITVENSLYEVKNLITSGGQGLLYRCKEVTFEREIKKVVGTTDFCIKEYYPEGAERVERDLRINEEVEVLCKYVKPVDDEQWKQQQAQIAKVKALAANIRPKTHLANYLPIKVDEENLAECSLFVPENCSTLTELLNTGMRTLFREDEPYSDLLRLKKSVDIIDALMESLIVLHEEAFSVHRDLTPSNVFWAKNKDGTGGIALPIDFACCVKIGERELFSVPRSPGYSNPALLDEDTSVQVDLYSLSTLLLVLATGKACVDTDWIVSDLTYAYNIEEPVGQKDLPYGVKSKLIKIISRATTADHMAKPYDSVREMREDIKLLLEIIDRKGMHPAVLFDASMERFNELCRDQNVFGYKIDPELRTVAVNNESKEPINLLKQNTVVTGPGGAGKTTYIRELFATCLKNWGADSETNPIPIYLQLSTFESRKSNWDFFIRDSILETYFPNISLYIKEPREALLGMLGSQSSYIFFLDGLDESVDGSELAAEIKMLASLERVNVLLTTRNDLDEGWSETKKFFRTAELIPLDDDLIIRKLCEKQLCSPSHRLIETLRRPMFLAMYLKLKSTDQTVQTPGEILLANNQYLLDRYKTSCHGKNWELAFSLTLDEILPEFAWIVDRMVFGHEEARKIISTIIGKKAEKANYRDVGTFLRSEGVEPDAFSWEALQACGLIKKTGNSFAFSHKSYLEFYQSFKVYKDLQKNVFPDGRMSPAVRSYLGDLLGEYAFVDNTEKASPVENHLKVAGEEPNLEKRQVVIAELIEVMKAARQNRITGCFDGLDLSLVDFSHCDLTGSSFHYAMLPDAAFLPFPIETRRQELNLCHLVPNSTWIISTNHREKKLFLWDYSQNMTSLAHVIKLGIEPSCIAVSPDGKKVAVRDMRYIEVYDLKSQKYLYGFNANNNIVISPKKEKVLESLDFCSKIYSNCDSLIKFSGNNSLIFNDGPYIVRANVQGKYQRTYVLPGSDNKYRICDCEVLSKKNRIFFLTDNGKIYVCSLKMGVYMDEYTLPTLPEPRLFFGKKVCNKIQVSPNQENICIKCNYGTDAVFLKYSGNEVHPFTGDRRIYGGCVSDNYIVQYDKSGLICRHAKDGSIHFRKELEHMHILTNEDVIYANNGKNILMNLERAKNMSISTDERILFIPVGPNKIRLYDMKNGEQIYVFRTGGPQTQESILSCFDGGKYSDKRSEGDTTHQTHKHISSLITLDGGNYSYRLSNGAVYLVGSSDDRLTLPSSTTCLVYYDDEYYFVETPGKSLEIWSLSSGSRELVIDTHSIFLSRQEAPYFAKIKYLPSHQKCVVVTLEGFIWIWNENDGKWKILNLLHPLRARKGMKIGSGTMCKVIGDNILSVSPRGDILQWNLDGRCVSHTKQMLDAEKMIPIPEQNCCMILIMGRTNKRYSAKVWDLEQKCFLEMLNTEEVYEFGDKEISPRNIWDFVRYDSRTLNVPKSINKHELIDARIEAGILVFAPNACISRNIVAFFDSQGVFSIYDKETGSLLRKIVLEISKNEILQYELSKSGDTLLVRFANDSIKVFGVFDYNLDKTIPLLLPDCISNCDFSKAILSNELKEALIQSDSTVIF